MEPFELFSLLIPNPLPPPLQLLVLQLLAHVNLLLLLEPLLLLLDDKRSHN